MSRPIASIAASTLPNDTALFDVAPVGLIVLDYNGIVTNVNDKALDQLGLKENDLLGRRLHASLDSVDAIVSDPATHQVLAQIPDLAQWQNGAVVELKLQDGNRAFKLGIREANTAQGSAGQSVLSFVDITGEWMQRREQIGLHDWVEDARSELNAFKEALERHSIVAMTDRTGRISYVNQGFCDISQYSREELMGQKHSIINSGFHDKSFFVEMWKKIGHGQRWQGEICNLAKDGSLYWVDTTIVPLTSLQGRIEGYVSIRYDITEHKKFEAALEEEVLRRTNAETLLLDIIETLPDGIAAYDANDRLVVFNSAYRNIYDRSQAAVVKGAAFEDILNHGITNGQFSLPDNNPKARKAWIDQRVREHKTPGNVFTQQLSDGRWLRGQEQRSCAGNVVGVRTDITALKEAEQRLTDQAIRDPLTGLFNRSVLMDSINQQLELCAQTGRSSALVVIDLDNFKNVNDTLGHVNGDEMLIEVSRRIQTALRSTDIAMRLGGDEFAIVISGLAGSKTINQVMQRLFKSLTAPVTLSNRQIWSSASAGVSVFPRDGTDPIELLKCADIALYRAKSLGRGRYYLFDSSLREEVDERESIANDLRGALERKEIRIALQPQFSIRDGSHCGFEALARWPRAENELNPDQFIPIAEEVGLITELGHQVLEQSLAEITRMTKAGINPGVVAVNVSASQLKNEEFPRIVGDLLLRYGVPTSSLEIEVTENVLLDRSSQIIEQSLVALHKMGIGIALDDFGTGHASLAHLKNIPVDRLKLDKSFVSGIGTNANDKAIVRAIISLAHGLGKKVVAEGIENADQLAMLKKLRCDIGQGFLVSKPLTPDQAEKFLT